MDKYSEKRQHERHPYKTDLYLYQKEKQDVYYEATLYNYSSGGMYVRTGEELDMNQEVFIKIRDYDPEAQGPERYERYTGYVRWSDELGTSHPGGQYGYGVEYSETVTD